MREIIPSVDHWLAQDEAIALATVVQTWGSAPRQVGAQMAFTASSALAGSVSGGCVEGAVIETGRELLATGDSQLLHFGVADETAWGVGLACGGTIEVFVQPLNMAVYTFLRDHINQEQTATVATIIGGPKPWLGKQLATGTDDQVVGELPPQLHDPALAAIRETIQARRLPLSDDLELFINVVRPAPTLVMVGGVHIAVALTALAHTVGFRTVVVDPRRAFGSVERFPHADQLLQTWPDKAFAEIELSETTAVALLTHDPKIDDPALKIALNSPAFYVGALGSHKTHARRVQRLRKMGVDEETIGRIHAPIGLDIGSRQPEEIALAVMAEIVQAQYAENSDPSGS